MNALKMEDEMFHFRHFILCVVWKGISVRTATELNIQVYSDHAPALRMIKKIFGRFCQDYFNLNGQPRSGKLLEVDEDAQFSW